MLKHNEKVILNGKRGHVVKIRTAGIFVFDNGAEMVLPAKYRIWLGPGRISEWVTEQEVEKLADAQN